MAFQRMAGPRGLLSAPALVAIVLACLLGFSLYLGRVSSLVQPVSSFSSQARQAQGGGAAAGEPILCMTTMWGSYRP